MIPILKYVIVKYESSFKFQIIHFDEINAHEIDFFLKLKHTLLSVSATDKYIYRFSILCGLLMNLRSELFFLIVEAFNLLTFPVHQANKKKSGTNSSKRNGNSEKPILFVFSVWLLSIGYKRNIRVHLTHFFALV